MSAVAGGFICLCYLNFMIASVVTRASALTAVLITAAVLCAVLLPMVFRRQLVQLFGRAYSFFKWAYVCGMWLYVITFMIFCFSVTAYPSAPERVYENYEQDDELVVLTFGCKTYGMTPGKALRRRLDIALELLKHYPNAVTVVSGGQGADESNTEAAAMQKYLIDHGVSEDRILIEDRSHNTIENIRNSLALLAERDLSDRPIIGVSHNYHALRIRLLAKRLGTEIHPVGYQTFDSAGLVREFMSYVKLFVFNRNLSA